MPVVSPPALLYALLFRLSRITTILNRNTKDVSTDLMLRVMAGLGYRATLTFSPVALS